MTDIIVSSTGPAIAVGAKVTLHFSLLLSSGEEVDTTRDGKPATFTVGDGSLLPGFESALLGKQAGYADQILLPAEQAFGEKNPANVQVMRRERFADMAGGQALEEGLMVSFKAPDGELPGVVVALYEDSVKVDFNHPLSGAEITFDVSIVNVEAAAS
jgi:FKBP-type peptidyl-prolyl cis-trans isomerase SlpA